MIVPKLFLANTCTVGSSSMIGGDRSPMLGSIFDYEYHTEGCTNKDGEECCP
jgi:hypothetical protein